MLVIVQIVTGVRRIDLLIGILSLLSDYSAVVSCKHHIIEGIIESSIQYSKAISGSSLEFWLLVRQGIEIR